jgi:hypothetical protein
MPYPMGNYLGLMRSKGSSINSPLTGKNARGNILIRAETVQNTRDVFVATFSGSKLVIIT